MMMNCELAAELLPWLLNGTLEDAERRQLIEHLRDCSACRAALTDTQMALDIFDWHPPPAALVAHAAATAAVGAPPAIGAGASAAPPGRDAAAPGARDIEDHLAGCPRCAAELELVRISRLLVDPAEDGRIAILPPPRQEPVRRQEPAATASTAATRATAITAGRPATVAAAPTLARRDDAAARRAWRRSALAASLVGLLAATGWLESARHSRDLERRLAAAPAPASAPATAPASAASPAAAPPGTSAAEARLAALANQNQQLQQQVAALGRTAAELSQRSDALRASQSPPGPRIESDLVVTDVQPAEQVERGSGTPATATIPLSSGVATLLLHTRHRDSYADYEIEVRDARGQRVGKPTRVLRAPGNQDSFEEFDITLGRGALAPGAYTLHLFGRTARTGRAGASATSGGDAFGPGGSGSGKTGREALETYSLRVS
jgi:hypothetical protein